jgi:hypothetical protein
LGSFNWLASRHLGKTGLLILGSKGRARNLPNLY